MLQTRSSEDQFYDSATHVSSLNKNLESLKLALDGETEKSNAKLPWYLIKRKITVNLKRKEQIFNWGSSEFVAR